MVDIAAGWYPDPAGGSGRRWWDGRQWTNSVAPDPQAAPVGVPQTPWGAAPTQAYPVQGNPGQGNPGQGYAGQPFAGQQPYGGQPNGQLPYTGGASSSPADLFRRNRYSAIATLVAIVYLVVELGAHITVFGILPILFAVRAFRAKERLAPVAAVAAGLAIIIAVVALSTR